MCGALPVMLVTDDDWGARFISYWRPSKEDLELLNAGGHVELQICGGGHPPVWLEARKVEELP